MRRIFSVIILLTAILMVSTDTDATSVEIVCHFVPTNYCTLSVSLAVKYISHVDSLASWHVNIYTQNLRIINGTYKSSNSLNHGHGGSAGVEFFAVVRDGRVKILRNGSWRGDAQRLLGQSTSASIKIENIPFEIERPEIPFARVKAAVWIGGREVATSEGVMTPEGCWYEGLRCGYRDLSPSRLH